ncbi:MAG TPA: branched-chain amino acid transporter AzlD [Clostridiales bacterium]|jgi:branched-subunit amino acid transport protein AzlD|nr:branched-chain amino acid transporter AzlD [Clostridiales bacterium]
MLLTPLQTFVMILAIALGSGLTRFTPFFLFPQKKDPPKLITYIGRSLPPAMMGLLVVFCLKGVSVTSAPHGIPELIAILVITAVHLWKGNVLLSIGSGTVVYMVLVQGVFS